MRLNCHDGVESALALQPAILLQCTALKSLAPYLSARGKEHVSMLTRKVPKSRAAYAPTSIRTTSDFLPPFPMIPLHRAAAYLHAQPEVVA